MAGKADILISEDDTVLREVYLKKFTLAGYDVRVASNGQEALDLIATKAPDALILDINMPVLDGFATLEKLPKDKRSYPVVILTNLADEENKKRGVSLGADDFFIKSQMTIKTLLEMVQNLVKK